MHDVLATVYDSHTIPAHRNWGVVGIEIGQTISHYKILRKLGHGGMLATASMAAASRLAAQGRVSAAMQELDKVAVLRAPDDGFVRFVQTLLGRVSRHSESDVPPIDPDVSLENRVMRGIQAACLGDSATLRECHRAMLRESETTQYRWRDDIRLLDAWDHALSGRWEYVKRVLEDQTRFDSGYWVGYLPVYLLQAEAFDHLQDLNAAVAKYRDIASPTRTDDTDRSVLRCLLYPFVHHRLILLYSEMGRVDDARRHWETFESTFTRPDPELVPMVEEARSALEKAEVKAAS